MARIVFGSLLACFLLLTGFLYVADKASAHHNEYLPGVPGTPAIQNLLADGERTWCTNAALANYPNALAQLRQTYDSQEVKLGNTDRFIAGTYESVTAAKNAGCDVWWFGRYDSFCTGCACSVHYASWPVTVNVSLSLGYFDYKSCFGHEEGHIHGLHEQYVDLGSIGCTRRTDTVMDCGSGVWELQPRDVNLVCNLYGVSGDRFHACAPPPPTTYPYWDGDEWVFESGWKYNPSAPSPYYGTPGNWTHLNGTPEFVFVTAVEGGEQWFNYRENAYHMKGSTFWRHTGGSDWECLSFCFGTP